MSQTLTQPSAPPSSGQLIMPFMMAVQEVFQTMAKVKITIGKVSLKTTGNATYGVCGIIGFSGEIAGSVVVSFSDTAAEKLIEAFAGVKMTRSDPDFADAVGELANMIAGSAKKSMSAVASISVPSVVIGKEYTIAVMPRCPCLVIPCGSPLGDFTVEVSIKRNPA